MLRRHRDLDVTQEFLLSGWTENYPLLRGLYHAKERFYDIWDSYYSRAETAYLNWKDSVPVGIRGYFPDLDRAIGNWHKEVFNYFDHRITNAKHKVKKKSFKAGVRENTLGYGLPNSHESNKGIEPFKQEFLNFGVLFPHGAEKPGY